MVSLRLCDAGIGTMAQVQRLSSRAGVQGDAVAHYHQPLGQWGVAVHPAYEIYIPSILQV